MKNFEINTLLSEVNQDGLVFAGSTIMSIETLIGICASIFTGFSPVPQLIKLIKSKKANDISYGMMLVLFAGLGLWIAYGVLKKDLIIVVSNSFSFLVNLLLLLFSIRYKNK